MKLERREEEAIFFPRMYVPFANPTPKILINNRRGIVGRSRGRKSHISCLKKERTIEEKKDLTLK